MKETKLEARLFIGKALIQEFDRLTGEIDPYEGGVPEVIRRARMVLAKMQRYYIKLDEPPQMLEQIDQLSSVINRLEQLKTRR